MFGRTRTQDIPNGAAVITRDGETLGSVKEVRGDFFKVDAPLHADYWLSIHLVQSQDATGVKLDLASESVAEHKMDAPEVVADGDPFQALAAEPVIGEKELLKQRADMEREMAEQSRALPPHAPSVTQMRGSRPFERIPADHTGFGSLAGEYVPNAPVQDRLEEALDKHHGSAMSRILTIAAPIVLASATLLGGMLLVRRMRRMKTETRTEHARRVVKDGVREVGSLAQDGAKELGALAQEQATAVAHAAKPKLKSTAVVGKHQARRLIHAGLTAAAKQFA